jgi:hypothetical protein
MRIPSKAEMVATFGFTFSVASIGGLVINDNARQDRYAKCHESQSDDARIDYANCLNREGDPNNELYLLGFFGGLALGGISTVVAKLPGKHDL